MATTRNITPEEVDRILEWLKDVGPANQKDVGKYAGRSHTAIRAVLMRDERFQVEKSDYGSVTYSVAPELGPYDVRYFGGVIRHKPPKGKRQ